MTQDQVLDEFRAAGALLEGHFILSSGLHSPVYYQKAFVFSEPPRTERLCRALAEKVKAEFGRIDVVVGPAVGGIVPGYETARHLGCRAIFTEREKGAFTLRRGFAIKPGERVLIVEDVITTGLSFNECAAGIQDQPGEIVGGACIIDRSGGRSEAAAGMKIVSLVQISVPTYSADNLPPELAAIPAVKPGSRGLAA
ncbi:MAG: orotate phosphoribosyltransferase [Hyphomonadaceae bacterium]|nr:orotate phosphoribosyltransferase [Hyphomonadaceae bacterium]